MAKRFASVLFFAAFIFFVSTEAVQVQAKSLNATQMYYSLQSMSDPNYAFWQGYVAGASDAFFADQSSKKCASIRVTVGQEVQIVKNYMGSNPKLWSLGPSVMVWLALGDAYHCIAS